MRDRVQRIAFVGTGQRTDWIAPLPSWLLRMARVCPMCDGPVTDRKRTMLEILMAGFMVIGFIASSTITLTLLLIVLGVIK